ncbi:NAD kinase [Rubeoparvulum massiliense]|uniref:NAD kinase n=1 Tax=Rubeoparvulum massiliense TaxID=1631346 RepID=UPI00065E3E0E|nr:NAD kinase [Rubeoparvulum massiliense]
MKCFDIVVRDDEISRSIQRRIANILIHAGWTQTCDVPDIVLSVGGDGTMLEAFHQYVGHLEEVAFVGLHTGRLGFYADWKPEDIDKLLEKILLSDAYETVEYPLVHVQLIMENEVRNYLALNECVIKSLTGTMVAQVSINGDEFEQFRGDGLCISTPSGSTAYNKSLGGAILHPSIEAIQVAEMASINNRVYRTIGSSIVLPKHHHCVITPSQEMTYQIHIDHLTMQNLKIDQVKVRMADEKIRFVRYRNFPFWMRVRASFIKE